MTLTDILATMGDDVLVNKTVVRKGFPDDKGRLVATSIDHKHVWVSHWQQLGAGAARRVVSEYPAEEWELA